MQTLEITLFGSFKAKLGERPLTRFRTKKLQALLIYLTVEKEKIHRRETLMGLLWPDLPQKSARNTLRQTLSLLRKTIPTQTNVNHEEIPFLISDRQTVQIHPDYPMKLDVHQFLMWNEAGQRQNDAVLLQQAVDLLQGDFLTDFYVTDSNIFEGWVEMQRGRLQRLGLEGMAALTAVNLSQHQFSQAEQLARRQIEIDDLREDAHRQLMRALAQNGRRHEALVQYDSLHKLLWDELGVAPEPATQTLLTQIEAGELASPKPEAELIQLPQPEADPPLFLTLSALTPPSEHDAFVARTAELEQLHARLANAIAGQTGIVFVTGEAGQGKSALLQAFMKQAIDQHETLLAADGTCSAVVGAGDPYHPIRQWMSMLTGDLESKWGLGTISSQWARKLWSAANAVVDAVLAHGPNLLGTLVPTAHIANKLQGHALSEENEPLSQPALFAQITAVLQTLAQQSPLLLVLDDMQWADSGTISLLFHLARQLRHSPILLLCAYRPSDVAAGRNGDRHPLEPVIHELGRLYSETIVSLENADHHAFVTAVIDSQPNQLDAQFRQRLYEQTGGHPLFTVELLREMRERRDLQLDEAIQWTTAGDLDWSSLPSRVESAMAERIDRLPDPLRDLLKIACVEGETFTAELLAQVQELSARQLVQSLSSQLDQQHRLIEVVGIDRLGEQRLSRYRFRHHLIYQYMQSQLDAVETVYLHEAVADALLSLAGDETNKVAVQLAYHYERASLLEKAFRFQQQASDEARRLSAQDEAQAHTQHALNLLTQLPPSPDRVPQRLLLQTAVLRPKIRQYGFGAPELVATLSQIDAEQNSTHLPTLFGLAMGALWGGDGRLASQWLQKLTQIANADDATGQLITHATVANLALLQGKLDVAEGRFQQAFAAANGIDKRELVSEYGLDVVAICEIRLRLVAELLGRREAVRETAVSFLTHSNPHPPTQAHILHDAIWLALRWGETDTVAEYSKVLNALAYEHDMRHWQAMGSVLMGWLLIQRDHIEDGTAQMEEGNLECAKLNCQLWFDLE